MKITSRDIRQKQFQKSLRGVDPEEVKAFLEEVATDYEELAQKNAELTESLQKAEKELEDHRAKEKTLQETLMAAQRIGEEMKEGARKESDLKLAEAELMSEKIVANANARLIQIVDDINELKRQRLQFESQLESLLSSHLKLLAATRSSDPQISVEECPSMISGVAARSIPPTAAAMASMAPYPAASQTSVLAQAIEEKLVAESKGMEASSSGSPASSGNAAKPSSKKGR